MTNLISEERFKAIKKYHFDFEEILNFEPDPESTHGERGYLIDLIERINVELETAERQREETVKALEEMVDEMAFLKSEFNVGDVVGLGVFEDTDKLMEKAGDIIINIRGYKGENG